MACEVRYDPNTMTLIPKGLHTSNTYTGYYSVAVAVNALNGTTFTVPFVQLADAGQRALLPPHPFITVTSPGVYQINKAGIYSIIANVLVPANNSGIRQINISRTVTNDAVPRTMNLNGDGSLIMVPGTSAGASSVSCNYVGYFDNGETFSVLFLQTSGVSLLVSANTIPAASPVGNVGSEMRITSNHF